MAATKTKSAKTQKARLDKKGNAKTKNQNVKVRPAKRPGTKIKRRRWFLLNSLVELDWNNYIRWTVAKETLLKDKVHIIDHDYEIKPINPPPDSHSPLQFEAGDRFLIIPIKEARETSSQRRYVLVHEEQGFEKGRLYLANAERPGGISALDDAFYQRIYVIGDTSSKLGEQEPHIIGAVEAVLTVSDPLAPWTGFPTVSSTQLVPLSPAAVTTEQPPAPYYDEDLLNRLDLLNEIKERHSQAGDDIIQLQNNINQYLSDQRDLKIIPIVVNQTRFNEEQGHILAGISHLTEIDDGIITAVRRSGYTCNGNLVRKANVIVNSHATRVVKLIHYTFDAPDTLQIEMNAPTDDTIGELMREAAVQIEALDSLFEWIHLFATATTDQLRDFAQRLLATSFTYENSREILKGANSRHLLMNSLQRDAGLLLTLHGETKSLKKLCGILDIEAGNRMNKSYFPPPQQGWIFKELNQLQPMPDGINQAKFAQKSDLILREILGRITFASDFQLPNAQPQQLVSQSGNGSARKSNTSGASKLKSAKRKKNTKHQKQ